MARVITSLPQICHNIKCQHKPIQPPSVHNCSINSEYYKLTIMARPFPSFLPGAQHGRNINQSRRLPTSGLDSVPSGRLTIEHLLTVSPPPHFTWLLVCNLALSTCTALLERYHQSAIKHIGRLHPRVCVCPGVAKKSSFLSDKDKELNDTDNSSLRIKRYG